MAAYLHTAAAAVVVVFSFLQCSVSGFPTNTRDPVCGYKVSEWHSMNKFCRTWIMCGVFTNQNETKILSILFLMSELSDIRCQRERERDIRL